MTMPAGLVSAFEKSMTVRKITTVLAIFGCVSTGLIYLGIGVVAMLSFFRIKEGGADEASLMSYLDHFIVGKIIVWFILLGTASYIIWRIYEAVRDPYEYGNSAKGLTIRSGIGISSLADAFIAFSAIQALLGKGNIRDDGVPEEQRRIIGNILSESWGETLIWTIGIIVMSVAVIQLVYGVVRGYSDRLDVDHLKKKAKQIIHLVADAGYVARAAILGIIGFFLVKAASKGDASYAVNTDKAFDFIGDHVGHVYFIIIAIGTICYGVFMFLLGRHYHAG